MLEEVPRKRFRVPQKYSRQTLGAVPRNRSERRPLGEVPLGLSPPHHTMSPCPGTYLPYHGDALSRLGCKYARQQSDDSVGRAYLNVGLIAG
ncbi:hypothetical protein RB195_005141 [Necator americanus]|uniref:Uncharacterized protein n=1 Tax=Necator americanus TaxID=51031 RepID=A0ABR1BPC7_NECAM